MTGVRLSAATFYSFSSKCKRAGTQSSILDSSTFFSNVEHFIYYPGNEYDKDLMLKVNSE